jgi:HSP20 family protein
MAEHRAKLAARDEKTAASGKKPNGVLVIKGERKTESEDKDRWFSERYYGRFERRIAVDDIEADKVTAAFNNGVLTVTLPKTAGASNVKRIAISTGGNKIEHMKAA